MANTTFKTQLKDYLLQEPSYIFFFLCSKLPQFLSSLLPSLIPDPLLPPHFVSNPAIVIIVLHL